MSFQVSGQGEDEKRKCAEEGEGFHMNICIFKPKLFTMSLVRTSWFYLLWQRVF